jgi:hypothetical protein
MDTVDADDVALVCAAPITDPLCLLKDRIAEI